MAFSMGIYQSYAAVAIILCVLLVIRESINSKSGIKAHIKMKGMCGLATKNVMQEQNMKFDKRMTNICKGIAIILMIIHHLFPGMNCYGLKIGTVWILPQIAVLGKVCVSIFLLLSGYGLYESDKGKELRVKDFWWKKFKSLYIDYWIIFVVFVLIGWLLFRDIFMMFIQEPYSPWKNLIISFLGIQYFFEGYQGINPSWWFVSQIVLLYLLFPLFRKLMRRNSGKVALLVFVGIIVFGIQDINISGFYISLLYVPSFIVGMFISEYHLFEKGSRLLYRYRALLLIVGMITLGLAIYRIRVGDSRIGIWLDCILASVGCCMSILFAGNKKMEGICNMLAYFGRHSFHIYLIHLFITSMYTTPYIYNLNSAFFMVVVTIIVSLAFSYLVNGIKIIPRIIGRSCINVKKCRGNKSRHSES